MIGLGWFETSDTEAAVTKAETIVSERKARYSIIHRDLLGEPGWDMLLYVFIARHRNLSSGMSDLARAANLEIDIAKRWAEMLVKHDLLCMWDKAYHLSDRGEHKMQTLLLKMVQQTSRQSD